MHPQATTATAPGQIPNFVDPTAIGAARPRIREMEGRVVVFEPLKIEYGVPGPNYAKDGKVQDRITTHVTVIDGGELAFGGAPEKGEPHTLIVNTPYIASDMFDSHVNLVTALTPHIGRGVVLGRIGRGIARGGNNPPWNLYPLTTDPTDRMHIANAERQGVDPVTLAQRNAQARQAVQAFYAAKIAGTWMNPTPRPIAGAPAPSTAHTYAASVTLASSAPIATPSSVIAAHLQGEGSAASLAQVLVDGTPALAAPPSGYDAVVWANLPEHVREAVLKAIAASAPPTTPAIPPAPAGWAPEVWAGLTDAQREQVLGASAIAAPSPPNPF